MAGALATRAAPGEAASVRPGSRPMAIASHAFLLIGAVATVFPFYWMLVTSLKTNVEATASPPTFWPQALQWGNYASALASAPFGRYFLNTLLVATCQVTGVLVVASLAAFAFARLRFFGKEVIFTIFLATLMIPGEVTLIPNFVIVTRWLGWYDTYQAQFVPGMASVFAIFLLRQFFMQIPRDLEDAAVMDGCGTFRFLWAIVVPLSRPALITVGLLNFLAAWNAFLWPLLVTRGAAMRPIQIGLSAFSGEAGVRYAELMAASTMVIVPTVAVFLVAQRYFIEGITRTGLKG